MSEILASRNSNKIETECFISDLLRAKLIYDGFSDLVDGIGAVDSYCKLMGY